MIRQQIILDKKTARLLRQTAKREKRTMSSVVRESVHVYVSDSDPKKRRRGSAAFLLEMSKNAVDLGPGNERLSEEIDTVLYS